MAILFYIALIFVTGIRPAPSDMSRFELRRLAKKGDLESRRALEREDRLQDVTTLITLTSVIFLILVVAFLIAASGWLIGIVLSFVAGLTYIRLSHTDLVSMYARKYYTSYEQAILNRIDRFVPYIKPFRTHFTTKVDGHRKFDSRQELQFSIQQSKDVLSDDERTLITAALDFKDQVIGDVMTPRNVVRTIHKDEFLGPLVLSELHDSGHSRLPVIDEDIDHVIGMLHVRDLLSLDNKKSTTAEKMMEQKVYYIHQDDTLDHALAAFIKSRHHLFVVINDQRETVGLLSLEDVIENLIGRKIVDEDDNHADLRAVALRKGKTNNVASGHVDL
jgi:putative hemolysin